MSKPFIRNPLPEDYDYLGANIRSGDRYEARLTPHYQKTGSYSSTIKDSHKQSKFCKVIEFNSHPIGIYGVAPSLEGTRIGSPWFCATPDISKIGSIFLKNSLGQVEKMHEFYPILFNYISDKNKDHIKWLRWLGFQVSDNSISGPNDSILYPFVRVK